MARSRLVRLRARALAPLSCCGSWSGHTHGCYLVSDRARKGPDHAPGEPCEPCERLAKQGLEYVRIPYGWTIRAKVASEGAS